MLVITVPRDQWSLVTGTATQIASRQVWSHQVRRAPLRDKARSAASRVLAGPGARTIRIHHSAAGQRKASSATLRVIIVIDRHDYSHVSRKQAQQYCNFSIGRLPSTSSHPSVVTGCPPNPMAAQVWRVRGGHGRQLCRLGLPALTLRARDTALKVAGAWRLEAGLWSWTGYHSRVTAMIIDCQ